MNNCWFTVLKLKWWDFSKRVQWTDSRRNHAVFMFSHLFYFWSESLLFLHHRKLNPVSQGRKALLDFVGCWGRVEGHRETGAEVAFIAPSPCPSTWWWSPLVACGTIFLRLSCDKVYVMAWYMCVNHYWINFAYLIPYKRCLQDSMVFVCCVVLQVNAMVLSSLITAHGKESWGFLM